MRNYIILFFSILLLVSSCGNASQSEASFHKKTIPESTEADYDFENQTQTTSAKSKNTAEPIRRERQIIKTANYRFQVKKVNESSAKIQSIVKDFSGYITSMNEATTRYDRSNNIVIRVPNDQFEKLLETLLAEAIHVNHKRINSRDVTEEFVDLEIRLKTKKDVRQKYIELLRNKAKSVKDVLAAEEAIRQLTEEIEAKEGRLRFLKNQVGMSTVNLEIYQKVEYKAEPNTYQISFLTKVKNAFVNGWELVGSIFIGMVNIWPLMILLGLIIWKRKRIFSFRRKRE